MSVSGRKGLQGENGVANYLNLWFPLHEQGIGAKRVRSKGANDIGDIDGVPYTCIEVKNHANPPVASLLDNALWKSENAGRPIWFLAYKREGYSEARASRWHCMVTVSGFLTGIMPTINGEPAFDVSEVEGLCDEYADIDCEIGAVYPGIPQPKHRWRLRIMFRPYIMSSQSLRDKDMSEFMDTLHGVETFEDESIRVLPIIITPRKGEDNPGLWYTYTNLHFQTRILESIGVVPQDPLEYVNEIKENE